MTGEELTELLSLYRAIARWPYETARVFGLVGYMEGTEDRFRSEVSSVLGRKVEPDNKTTYMLIRDDGSILYARCANCRIAVGTGIVVARTIGGL